jgi:hypothetical protein
LFLALVSFVAEAPAFLSGFFFFFFSFTGIWDYQHLVCSIKRKDKPLIRFVASA